MPQVGIRRTRIDRLDEAVEELLDLIGYTPQKEKILLKPNIVAAVPPENGIPHIAGCHPDYREIVNFFCPGTYPELARADSKNRSKESL